VKHFVQEIADDNQGTEGEKLKRQQSAVQRATKVLLNRHAAPTAVVLTYLPWLISASPKHALSVLKVPHQPYLDACSTLSQHTLTPETTRCWSQPAEHAVQGCTVFSDIDMLPKLAICR